MKIDLIAIESAKREPESILIDQLIGIADLDAGARGKISQDGAQLVTDIRAGSKLGLMEVFLAEYGLSTDEGVALMCLAEALLRVPDAETIEDLIEDKIAPSDWGKHLGKSSSSLVNASTWALLLTGKILNEEGPSMASRLRGAAKRLGEPVIRTAVGRAMKEMGRQFVLSETIEGALTRAKKSENRGYSYSYDMLGEAAMTATDAEKYRQSYLNAIRAIGRNCKVKDIRKNPGISVKLSALHPRYEVAKTERVMNELVPIVQELCREAATAGMGLNIDAEEADRLGLSLKVIKAVLSDEALRGWDGFGVVLQAYGRRSVLVLDWLHELVEGLDRRITVRLVKGAYWDTEIKHAQVEGLDDFPVYTKKPITDVSYIAMSRKLLDMRVRIYPQFATHNAHTVAAILHMADGIPVEQYEFQRLHGMGEQLHDIVLRKRGTHCRIYAPIGAHRDLLAYLVRRLLENGANSSFVNQIVDERIPPAQVATCPFEQLANLGKTMIPTGPEIFQPERANSIGWDVNSIQVLADIDEKRDAAKIVDATPLLAVKSTGTSANQVLNPANGSPLAQSIDCNEQDVEAALASATPWDAPVAERAAVLAKAADLYERDFGVIFSLLAQEAGKTLADAVGELREAVDFLRYYAAQAQSHTAPARGVFACISPWNFPLAIFSGQIAAALATGNGVLAKPAETTPLIATHAVRLLHEAGVPKTALQLLPGAGAVVGAAITSDPRVHGVAFTGSTATALRIRRAMADGCAPDAPLIAETGGLNAMIVDSTALPEQAVGDIVASAFQSAGQRCSALRCLYVQEDIAPILIEMLTGAMDELELGDPWQLSTDVGPVIDQTAQLDIQAHVDQAKADGRLIKQLDTPEVGTFVAPAMIQVTGIGDLEREIFGPVLHVATFTAQEIDDVVRDINGAGFGLTFGMHSRIDGRVQKVTAGIRAGNLYVNRNQIGAVVGSQPFGGEGLSGTGPKAGGPNYLTRFTRPVINPVVADDWAAPEDLNALQQRLDAAPSEQLVDDRDMPGPTGESNRLRSYTRSPVLCLGPGEACVRAQMEAAAGLGGIAVAAIGGIEAQDISKLQNLSGVIWWGNAKAAKGYAQALAELNGPIIPLICGLPDKGHLFHERHLCIDTTAAGGNTALLSQE